MQTVLRALFLLLGHLPLGLLHALGAGLGLLLWLRPNRFRRITELHLARCLPEDAVISDDGATSSGPVLAALATAPLATQSKTPMVVMAAAGLRWAPSRQSFAEPMRRACPVTSPSLTRSSPTSGVPGTWVATTIL